MTHSRAVIIKKGIQCRTIHSDIAINLSYKNICSRNGNLIKLDYKITGYKTFADVFLLIAVKIIHLYFLSVESFLRTIKFSPDL